MNAKKAKKIRRTVRQRYVGLPMCEYNHAVLKERVIPMMPGYRFPQLKLTDDCLRKRIKRAKRALARTA